MSDSKNVYGTSKMTLAMKLYGMLIDEYAVDLQECTAEQFAECFLATLRDYGLFLKTGMIE